MVQSVCLTSRGSGVRLPLLPPKSDSGNWIAFFRTPSPEPPTLCYQAASAAHRRTGVSKKRKDGDARWRQRRHRHAPRGCREATGGKRKDAGLPASGVRLPLLPPKSDSGNWIAFFSYTLPRTPDPLLPSGCSVEYICRREPPVQNIEQAYRPHSGVEWHFTCSMRSKWRHRADKSAPQPLRTTLALLDELHEELSQGQHLPCSMIARRTLCTKNNLHEERFARRTICTKEEALERNTRGELGIPVGKKVRD